jgi:hypothetical protein|tara:strand:+ start:214 stop:615 length:402 start_codon:yes stop_codon:yes gene_type:complete
MSNFKIHKDRTEEPTRGETADETTSLYTILGKQDWVDEDGFPRMNIKEFDPAQVHAKAVEDSNKTKFYIKKGRYGKPFDPMGIYTEGTEYKQKRHAGKPEWELKPVSEKAFNFYINFLRTKNFAWLRNAEREI